MAQHSNVLARVFVAMLAACIAQAATAYDPLPPAPGDGIATHDTQVADSVRQRTVPVLVYLPKGRTPAPVVVFSHGLGGSRTGSAYLGRHWAGRGYMAVFVQHPGSDVLVWQDKPVGERMSALREAATLQNLLHRVYDVRSVLDQLGLWNVTAGHVLRGRLDLERIGMAGHSFGAITTQALGGQRTARGEARLTDARIKAAIAFSPSSPRQGDPKQAFGGVQIPWLLMTGTMDTAFIGNADVASRLRVFPALPPGGKYELVLERAEHSAFTDRSLPGDSQARNPNHHRAILALSTAFWDAWLRGDREARTWLDGDGPRSILESQDRWQRK